MADFSQWQKKIKDIERYLNNDLPRKIGVEGVNHFKQSFQNEGFTDTSLELWEDVKRRDPESDWYGFQYRSRAARPGKKRRKEDSITNYSPAATKRKILSGETGLLMNTIDYMASGRRIQFRAFTPYSKVQNEGGKASAFGKATTTIPQRKFMGDSEVLRMKIKTIIERDLKRILG